MKIPIDSIKIDDRERIDMGDIGYLRDSISLDGLIYPVVVDADLNLIDGHRRLTACRALGWEEIDVSYDKHGKTK